MEQEDFNEWFRMTLKETKTFKVDEKLDLESFILYKNIEKWYNYLFNKPKPYMLKCRDFTNLPKFQNLLFNNNHEYMCQFENKDPYKFYTTDNVIIKGYLYSWENTFYRKVFRQ